MAVNSQKYNINYDNLVKWLTPWFLRSPFMVSWLKALLEPIKTNYSNFKDFKKEKVREARTTSQTIVLESALNDIYDTTQRRIQVLNAADAAEYIYTEAEATVGFYTYLESESPTGSDRTYLFFEGESTTSLPENFRVSIPSSVSSTKVRNFVERYKMVGFSFDVTTF